QISAFMIIGVDDLEQGELIDGVTHHHKQVHSLRGEEKVNIMANSVHPRLIMTKLMRYSALLMMCDNHDAKLMSKYGINVPKDVDVGSVEEINKKIKSVFPYQNEIMVQSQVLAGSRGLGTFKNGLKGGVNIVKADQVEDIARNLLSHTNGAKIMVKNSTISGLGAGIEIQHYFVNFKTLAADITPTTTRFPVDSDESYLDQPSIRLFSSISEAIEDIHDEDRENEGDLIMAGSKITPEAMTLFVKHGTGIVCVRMKVEDLEILNLPLIVNSKDNEEKL
ncbi:hypothetical protein ACH5RR_039236, partial [Cinchona calisaya]